MLNERKPVSAIRAIILLLVILNVLILRDAFTTNKKLYWNLIVTLPILLLAIEYKRRKK